MRAIGASNKIISTQLIGEGLTLGMLSWLIAVPLSIPASCLMNFALGWTMKIEFTFIFSYTGVFIWLIITLVLSVLASWLFPQMAAVVHHGGAGTTAAGLRAGIPTIIVSGPGDQPFWGHRVKELGVGPAPIPRRKLTADKLAAAIAEAVTNAAIQTQAATLGQTIRTEDGVGNAVRVIQHQIQNTKL
jgi:hypothetical protein